MHCSTQNGLRLLYWFIKKWKREGQFYDEEKRRLKFLTKESGELEVALEEPYEAEENLKEFIFLLILQF